MSLIRIALYEKELTRPSLEILSTLKGLYSVECVFFDGKFELLLSIKDKYIRNIIESNSRSELLVYFAMFGLKPEILDNYEIVEENYLKERIENLQIKLISYFDFSPLLVVDSPNPKFFRDQNDKNVFSPKREKNLFEEIVRFLIELNLSFILQIFWSKNGKNLLIGGQLVLGYQNTNFKYLINTIKENLAKKLLYFKIIIRFKSFFFMNTNSYLQKFYNHIPIKFYPKNPILINNLLMIPNFSFLSNSTVIYDEKHPTLNSNTINDGIPIGYKVIPGLKDPPVVKISYEELTSHFSCFGITSQGKSRLMYNFLSYIDKTDKNFLVIDPKGEYFEALANSNRQISYYKVGSFEFPLTLNIFSVPEGLSSENHIQFIYSLLLSIMGDEVTPQMNRLLFKAIEYTINSDGGMKEFLIILENPEKLKIKGSYLDMSGNAVINRLLPLIIGPAKNCFLVKKSSIDFTKLNTQNVIIDLSNFELVESTISRKIFVNSLLHYFIHSIKRKNQSIRSLGDISNFIFIEEIQKIAPLTFQGKNEVNSFIGLAPWTVRAYGICMGFIGTDSNVESPIISNTGLNLIFYSKSNIEIKLRLMGISSSDYIKFLEELKERRRFLLCYKGTITLVQAFDFQIPNGSIIKDRYEYLINSNF